MRIDFPTSCPDTHDHPFKNMPSSLCGLPLQAIRNMETNIPGAGYAISFRRAGVVVSGLVYDNAWKDLREGLEDPRLVTEMEAAAIHLQLEMINGSAREITASSDVTVLRCQKGFPLALTQSFHVRRRNKAAARADIYLMVHEGDFWRLTVECEESAFAERYNQRLAREFLAKAGVPAFQMERACSV